MKAILVALLVAASLVGCADKVQQYESVEPKVGTFHPPLPDPIRLDPLEFVVITKDTAPLLMKEDSVYVALTWEDYLNLGKNSNTMLMYIRSQVKVLCYYRKSLNEDICKK